MGSPAKHIMTISRNFWDSQVLLVSAHLRIFDSLTAFTSTAAVSKRYKLNERAVRMLLDGLVSLAILEKKGTGYRLREEFAPYLVSTAPFNVLSILNHYYFMWHDWGRLLDSLKTGRPRQLDPVPQKERRFRTREFIKGMDNLTKFQRERVGDAIDLKNVRKVLDIGSGPATYLRAIMKERKDVKATILDFRDSAAVAKEFLRADGLHDRVSFIHGDLREKKYGKGYDAAFIFQVLHSLDPDTKKLAVKKAYDALNKGGRLYIHEFYMNEQRTFPKDNVIFCLNMLLHADPGGDNLTPSEIKKLMTSAGFVVTRTVRFKNPHTILVEGTKK